METEEVETLETTDTDQTETSNTDNETNENETLSTFEQAFNLDALRDEEETLAHNSANENETESENNEDEITNEDTENENPATIFEFKSGETLEKYDLSKEEDREKLKTYFEFGRHGSQKLGEINQKEATLKTKESQLEASAELILNQYLKNLVTGIEIVEKPDYETDTEIT